MGPSFNLGIWFRVQGLGIKVWGAGFSVWGSWFRVSGFRASTRAASCYWRFKVWALGFEIWCVSARGRAGECCPKTPLVAPHLFYKGSQPPYQVIPFTRGRMRDPSTSDPLIKGSSPLEKGSYGQNLAKSRISKVESFSARPTGVDQPHRSCIGGRGPGVWVPVAGLGSARMSDGGGFNSTF